MKMKRIYINKNTKQRIMIDYGETTIRVENDPAPDAVTIINYFNYRDHKFEALINQLIVSDGWTLDNNEKDN